MAGTFFEGQHEHAISTLGSSMDELRGDDRLANTGGSDEQGAGSAVKATAEQRVEIVVTTLNMFPWILDRLTKGDQAWEHHRPTRANQIVMVASDIVDAAQLADRQPAS